MTLALLLLLAVVAGGSGYLERIQRTAEAPIEIVMLGSYQRPHPLVPGGYSIHYRFVADGVAHEYVALRSWSLSTIKAAKVCYNPDDPANQSLTRAGAPCG